MALVDPATVDPKTILATIAADPHQPASARVAAAKALLTLSTVVSTPGQRAQIDRVSQKALELLAHGRAN